MEPNIETQNRKPKNQNTENETIIQKITKRKKPKTEKTLKTETKITNKRN